MRPKESTRGGEPGVRPAGSSSIFNFPFSIFNWISPAPESENEWKIENGKLKIQSDHSAMLN
jgi:hypothetical protein